MSTWNIIVGRLIRRSGFKILMRQDSTHRKSDLSGGNEPESHGDWKIILSFFVFLIFFSKCHFLCFLKNVIRVRVTCARHAWQIHFKKMFNIIKCEFRLTFMQFSLFGIKFRTERCVTHYVFKNFLIIFFIFCQNFLFSKIF